MFQPRKFAALLVLAGALSLAGPAAAAAPATAPPPARVQAAAPHPAIWLLADEDTRIYLFGTIHILPPELNWRSVELNRIAASADELVLEVGEDPAEDDPAALAPMMAEKTLPILERVSQERRDALRRMIEELGLTAATFDGMQTWAAAMAISAASLAREYAKHGSVEELSGVEEVLRTEFQRSHRPISGVETAERQMTMLSGLSPAAQTAMLEEIVDDYAAGNTAATDEPSDEDWARGDITGVAAEMAELPPELFDILVTRRNTSWTDWLIARLRRPGTVLFAVGAGHLAGRDSLQSMLEAHGYRVTRLN